MENIFPYKEFLRITYDPSRAILSATKERIKRAIAEQINIAEAPTPIQYKPAAVANGVSIGAGLYCVVRRGLL